jgi:hypothetical protein
LWYGEPNALRNAIGYAMHRSRSHYAVIRVYDEVDNVIETHEQAGDFADPIAVFAAPKRIGLKSYRRLFGTRSKIILDYVIRRLNGLSTG